MNTPAPDGTGQEIERRRVELRDHTTEVRTFGSGPPVVLVHSLGLDQEMWEPVAHRLAATGRQVFSYDVRGHGTATDAPPSNGIAVLAEDLGEVLSSLGLTRPTIVGTSLGGVIGQQFAAEHREAVRFLGLIASPTAGVDAFEQRARAGEPGLRPLFEDTLERWFGDGFDPDDPGPSYAIDCLGRLPVAHWQSSWRALASFSPSAGDLDTVPMVLIAGETDTSTPASVMRTIIDRGATEQRRIVVVPDAPHLLVITHPEEVTDALLRTSPVPAPAD